MIFLVCFVVGIFYLVPSLLAFARDTVHWPRIALFNILLGWTVLAWLVALVWALVDRPKVPENDAWPT